VLVVIAGGRVAVALLDGTPMGSLRYVSF